MQVSLKLFEASQKRYDSWKNVPKKAPELESIQKSARLSVSPKQNLEKRVDMLRESAQEPLGFAYERAIGKNDSVYSNFTDILNHAKRKVGRIVIKQNAVQQGFATGFMVSERLMLTNWHVFETKEAVGDSEIQFNFEYDASGRAKPSILFKLAPDDFYHSNEALDYCLVAVQTMDVHGATPLSDIGYHYLNPALGKLAGEGQEFLNIIHHPDGDFMQLSIRENKFVKILDNTLWYEADTSPGSSGSPVFNDQFQVVALHHMGVAKKSKDGKDYLDKNGKVIEPQGDTIDTKRVVWIANEGIRISRLLEDLFKVKGDHPMVKGLQVPDPRQYPMEAAVFNGGIAPANGQNIQVSIPAAVLQASGVVQVAVQNRPGMGQGNTGEPVFGVSGDITHPDLLLEQEKLTQEEALDFADCTGYDPSFMGVKLPIPQPSKPLQPFVANLKDGSGTELKYHHYSVIHHAVRKMPIISAINVDGDPTKRLDDSKRKDNWLRDKRIDLQAQLDDKYYTNSGFDRGHMSRREDANWGDTADDARKFADMTCMHTNACPQVVKLNRSNSKDKDKGLWGKLENVILEKGVEAEAGAQAKIAVFNGPIFADTDPVFRGVQVPLDFWKIVVWKDDQKKVRATGFKLTQRLLVKDIDFEAIDLDKNVDFQQYQVSIETLAKLTQIDFSGLAKYDTFPKKSGKPELKIGDMEALEKMLAV